ncbi:MAG: M3 family metallopeptidase [Gammaproteobacteria bacterium]|nr:M3 family metallopeptidase [Gammaproteobacteria bacterium]
MTNLISELPDFNTISPDQVATTLDHLLAEGKKKISNLLNQEKYTWENLIEPLEIGDENLDTFWSTVSHLHAVRMDVWREAYQTNLPKIIEYHTVVSQNEHLFNAYEKIYHSSEYTSFSLAQKKVIENALRDFKLSGVHLPKKEKELYAKLQQDLAALMTQFEQNLVDATQAWSYETQDETILFGLPEHTLLQARENAMKKNKQGWVLTLDYPTYFSVMTYAENRSLRELFYEAYTTRASTQGPHDPRYDNSQLINDILIKRQCLAEILGFPHYAQLSLEEKMLKKPEEVLGFLNDMVAVVKKKAEKERKTLSDYAKKKDALEKLEVWDVSYYREKLQYETFSISDDALRCYFPVYKVIQGLFTIVNKLYAVLIREEHAPVWHETVKFYAVYTKEGVCLGGFYFDLYTRPEKREGAWAADARNRLRTPACSQRPLAYLNCNFEPPTEKGAFLTHEQVITLFHEFGHGLHQLLSVIDYPAVTGTHGVPWDVVEVPSQLFENWCWEKESIQLISERLPEGLLDNMIAAKNFCAGMDVLRQLEFSLFDFELHTYYDKHHPTDVNFLLETIRAQLDVMPVPAYNRFANSFAHIFAGEYAAGYYSYLWAEVMSSDIFSKFKQEGIFNQRTAQSYLKLILSQGGVCDPLASFFEFMGRNPRIEAFLKQRGFV